MGRTPKAQERVAGHARPSETAPPSSDTAPDTGADPESPGLRLATRTRTGQLLRDVARQLDEALAVLVDETTSAAVEARARLEAAREAVALLALERAAPRPAREPDRPDPVLVRRTVVDAGPSSPEAARRFCRQTCDMWSVPGAVVNAVIDIASELVANAVQHASGPVVLSIELESDGVRIGAWDDGPGRPRLLPYRAGISERGIGLQLVTHLSEDWGCSEDQNGKWVWARVPLPAAGSTTRSPGAGRRGS